MKIAVLVSGGVDSSVALALLKEQGHELTAFYLKIWLEDELDYLGQCPWEEDLEYIRPVCEQLDIPLRVLPLQREYQQKIISYTIAEVKAGRTPNPDLMCNNRIKFGAFTEKLDSGNDKFDKIASGHYAGIRLDADGRAHLLRNPDPVKDQTYFLAHLSREQLSRIVFPLGPYTKEQVRELAKKFNLPNQDRKDSQGLCFLGKIRFSDFIKHHLGTRPGPMIEWETGKEWGRHEGFWYYTIGQRKGLGLSHGPWFVVARDPGENIVYISNKYETLDQAGRFVVTEPPHWIAGEAPEILTGPEWSPADSGLVVKLRHGPQTKPVRVRVRSDGGLDIQLSERDQGLAAGQFVVFYLNGECLGCAVMAVETETRLKPPVSRQSL